jgi:hypothetical protein
MGFFCILFLYLLIIKTMPVEFKSKIKYVYQILNRPLKEFYKYISTGTGGFQHYIGEEFGGGIIFNLWKDENGEEHGLIMAKNPLNNSIFGTGLYCSITTSTGGTSLIDGKANTDAILALPNIVPGVTISSALDLQTYSEGGYTDWYMGAVFEYAAILDNRFIIAQALERVGGTPLLNGRTFISSTETGGTQCNAITVAAQNTSNAIGKNTGVPNAFTPIRKF